MWSLSHVRGNESFKAEGLDQIVEFVPRPWE